MVANSILRNLCQIGVSVGALSKNLLEGGRPANHQGRLLGVGHLEMPAQSVSERVGYRMVSDLRAKKSI
jgi:hypothetical protein